MTRATRNAIERAEIALRNIAILIEDQKIISADGAALARLATLDREIAAELRAALDDDPVSIVA